MKNNIYINPDRNEWDEIMSRPQIEIDEVNDSVQKILTNVKAAGNKMVKYYSKQFDGFNSEVFKVSAREIEQSEFKISEELKKSILTAKDNIFKFHKAQRTEDITVETIPGIECKIKSTAIEKVGLYIPGGTAPLMSTVLMLAVPAKIAGCKEVLMCTPAGKNKKINPAILYAAKVSGVKNIYKIGGAQAIAAMAYGTETIPKVYKIFGPGNKYVTAAKMLVSTENTAIDMPAGPSELMVVADETGNPEFIASDLLSQAEHDTDSQVMLVTSSNNLIDNTLVELKKQIQFLPRKEIAAKALINSKIILLKEESDMLDFANQYAPEHLIISMKNENEFSEKVVNAGSVFIGSYTPESAGDYASGTNHTLPVGAYARAYSGITLQSFMKTITFQKITKKGLLKIGKTIENMAEAEQLFAHKNAVKIRLNNLIKTNKMFNLKKAVRKNILDIKPYVSARVQFSGTAKVFLDANENSFGSAVGNNNRYPDPLQKSLKNRISEYKNVPYEEIFLGNGSNEVIDLIIRAFSEPRFDEIVIFPPTYGMYKVCAGVHNVNVIEVPLKEDFSINSELFLEKISSETKIVFICSPNNPTGNISSEQQIIEIAENFNGIVVLDEAYIEFSKTKSLIKLINEYPNLIVLQTFSKAWGLPNLRLGVAYADKEIINILKKIVLPYNINGLTQQLAIKAFENIDKKDLYIKEILIQKEKLITDLKELRVLSKVYSSETNFILLRSKKASKVYEFLKDKGIIIRNLSKQKYCVGFLRVTVGTEQENKLLTEALREFMN